MKLRLTALLAGLTLGLAAGLVPTVAEAAPTPSPSAPAVSTQRTPLARVAALPDPGTWAQTASGRVVAVAQARLGTGASVAGVTWPKTAEPPTVLYRTLTDGKATAWQRVTAEAEQAGESSATSGTEPVVVTAAGSVEVATLSTKPVAAVLSVHAAPAGPAASTTKARMSTTSTVPGPARPAIKTRADWGANESIVRLPYEYGVVTGVMIHHTSGTNTYTPADVPGILRAIQAYHVNTRGWKDIAYNVLVDRFGTAWEGRGGGLDRAVAGGHAWGITNQRVFGLSFLGDFEAAAPPAEMISKAEDVIAWKFALHGVDPYGTTYGSGGQDGGSTFLNAISGHRDENNTDCPGKNVYRLLSQMRYDVRARLAGSASQPPAPSEPTPPPAVDPASGKVTLAVTGVLDSPTITELQRWVGAVMDGVWGTGTTTALQRTIGAPVTGQRDVPTVTKLQEVVGAPRTGQLDAPTVSALQVSLNARPVGTQTVPPTLGYAAHVQNIGWQAGVADGAVAGTVGQSLRVEALRLSIGGSVSGGILYRGHVQNVGWQPWVTESTFIGTLGRSHRLEAFEIKLTGDLATKYQLQYRAHVQDIGWQAFQTDGGTAGTVGRALRVEAVSIRLVPRDGSAPAPANPPANPEPPAGPSPAVATYAGHVQNVGWMGDASDGATTGLPGKGLRLEALRLKVTGGVSGEVSMRGHVQDIGWQAWTPSSGYLGTMAQARRLEAFQVKLTGDLAARYTIAYRAWVQGIGWQPWVADGATAGTVGQSLRIEAVEVVLKAR